MLKRFFRNIKIKKICKFYRIKNYTINKDGSIDVNGDVNLINKRLSKLPIKFRNVTGFFICESNNLTSLEGCPKSVGSNFYCDHNKLTTLEDGPISVGGGFYCGDNKLTSLEGGPISVGGSFYCDINKLNSLKGCPESVGGYFSCSHNNITTFEHLPFSIGGSFYYNGNPIYEVWKLFRDYSKIEFLNDCDALREPNIIIKYRLNCFLEEIVQKKLLEQPFNIIPYYNLI